MKKKRENQSIDEEEDSVEVAMPVWLSLIPGELDHQSASSVHVTLFAIEVYGENVHT